MSLLDDAKKIRTKNRFKGKLVTKDECELVIAYLNGEIRPIQVASVLNLTNSQRGALQWIICKVLEAGLDLGLIEIKLVDK